MTDLIEAACQSGQRRPSPDIAPDAWQWRYRAIGETVGEWNLWQEGRAPHLNPANYDVEERPLYSADALAAQAAEIERLTNFNANLRIAYKEFNEAGLLALKMRDEALRDKQFWVNFCTVLQDDLDKFVAQRKAAEARADALAARVAELEAALTEAEDTLQLCEHPSSQDPAHRDAVASLGDRIGYGALMSTASALWRDHLIARGLKGGGEFVSGPCRSTVLGTLKIIRAALHGAAPAGEGGGS